MVGVFLRSRPGYLDVEWERRGKLAGAPREALAAMEPGPNHALQQSGHAMEVTMSRTRWTILAIAVSLVAGCSTSNQPADVGPAERLDGSWIVTSVRRDGALDPLQIGAQLTFTDHQV